MNATLHGKTERGLGRCDYVKGLEMRRGSWVITGVFVSEAEEGLIHRGDGEVLTKQKTERDLKMLTSKIRSEAVTSRGMPAAASAEEVSPRASGGSDTDSRLQGSLFCFSDILRRLEQYRAHRRCSRNIC